MLTGTRADRKLAVDIVPRGECVELDAEGGMLENPCLADVGCRNSLFLLPAIKSCIGVCARCKRSGGGGELGLGGRMDDLEDLRGEMRGGGIDGGGGTAKTGGCVLSMPGVESAIGIVPL